MRLDVEDAAAPADTVPAMGAIGAAAGTLVMGFCLVVEFLVAAFGRAYAGGRVLRVACSVFLEVCVAAMAAVVAKAALPVGRTSVRVDRPRKPDPRAAAAQEMLPC